MTTCRECRNPVSAQAQLCPACGVVSPGIRPPTEDERRVRREREKRLVNTVAIAVGLPVLIILTVAVYRASTGPDVDAAAREACAAVERRQNAEAFTPTSLSSLMEAVAAAQRSEAEGLRKAGQSSPPAGTNALDWRFARVAAWCGEND
jgi:predicted anti-sigma-YlaC factor YlaD